MKKRESLSLIPQIIESGATLEEIAKRYYVPNNKIAGFIGYYYPSKVAMLLKKARKNEEERKK